MTDDILDSALGYASHGIYIFPARILIRGDGKKDPRFPPSWKEASTINPDVIRSWYGPGGLWQGGAICIDCGKSGLVVVDQDVSDGKRGPEEWAIVGQKSEGRVITGSGGYHDYFRADPDNPWISVANRGEVADGVDIRGDGGLVFAPPTVDPRGGMWSWEGSEPDWAELPIVPRIVPDRLRASQESKRPKVEASTSPLFASPSNLLPNTKTATAAADLMAREMGEFERLTEEGSGRSHILAQRLAVLAGHGVGVFWTHDDALDALMDACVKNGFSATHSEAYARDQALRGLEYGMRQPWTRVEEPAAAPAPSTRLRGALVPRSAIRHMPKPTPLVEGAIFAQSMVVISGKFGTYKTFLTVGMACSLTTGTPWLGHAVPAPVPVIYAAAEGAYGIGSRIDAWEEMTGIPVPDTFHLISVSARLNRPEDMIELEELLVETGAKVVVFDTLHASTPGIDENDSGQTGLITETIRHLMHTHGITVILPHHTGHAGERARGSSALEDDADTSFVIRLGGDGEDRRADNPRTLHHRKAKDSVLLEPLELQLEECGDSAYVRARNPFEAIAGTGDAWDGPTQPITELVIEILSAAGYERGLTKSEAHAIVLERWYGGQKARLKRQTWNSGWNRTLLREEVVNVGGDRFTVLPDVSDS